MCPCCGAASRPEGGALVLWGHGLRERSVRGPGSWDAAPTEVVIRVRRYLCRACGQSCTVVPKGLAPGYLYAGFAIALALALWAIQGECPANVRRAVSPWQQVGVSQTGRWRSLARWVAAVASGRLFPGVATGTGAVRTQAARVAHSALSRAPPSDRGAPFLHRAWRGGEVMA